MRLALAQINAVVGDLDGNRERILAGLAEAKAAGADLVLFPELAVTGYPPEDLLLRPGFVRAAEESLRRDRARDRRADGARGNALVRPRPLQRVRGLRGRRDEGALPQALSANYGVFDEERYFAPGRELSCSGSARSSSGRRSARTSGSPGRPRPISRSRAPSCSSTSPPRRTTSARRRSARRCSSRGRATTRPTSPSATSSAARTSCSSTATRSCSTTRARCSRGLPASRRRCSSSTSTRARRSAAGCATCAGGRLRGSARTSCEPERRGAPR